MRDAVAGALGLAAKAGKTKSGEFQTENAVRGRKAYLVLIAGDASENTKEKFRSLCEYYQVPFEIYGTRESLGQSIGKEHRASLAVTDERLSELIKEKLGTV